MLINVKKLFGNLKRKIKKASSWFYLKHSKLYTTLILIIGIFLGCLYEGRGDFGELVFSYGDYTIYVGGFVKQPLPGGK